jgi:hypothetical protein
VKDAVTTAWISLLESPSPDEGHIEQVGRDQEAHAVAPVVAERGEFPVTIYLADERIHEQVQSAVENLVNIAGADIVDRDDPVFGSWFRRLRAKAAVSPGFREVAATAAHAIDARLVLSQDAAITTTMMQNLGPVLTALQPTKEAVVRVGALLIVKVNDAVAVHQLTAAQQVMLDHQPHLLTAPQHILRALNLASSDEPPTTAATAVLAAPSDRDHDQISTLDENEDYILGHVWVIVWHGVLETDDDELRITALADKAESLRSRWPGCVVRRQGGDDYTATLFGPAEGAPPPKDLADQWSAFATETAPTHPMLDNTILWHITTTAPTFRTTIYLGFHSNQSQQSYDAQSDEHGRQAVTRVTRTHSHQRKGAVMVSGTIGPAPF